MKHKIVVSSKKIHSDLCGVVLGKTERVGSHIGPRSWTRRDGRPSLVLMISAVVSVLSFVAMISGRPTVVVTVAATAT